MTEKLLNATEFRLMLLRKRPRRLYYCGSGDAPAMPVSRRTVVDFCGDVELSEKALMFDLRSCDFRTEFSIVKNKGER